MKISKYTNSIFEQPWWLDTVAQGNWREILVEENGEVSARWPIVEKNKSICMPILTQTLGFWISDKVLAKDKCYSQKSKLTSVLLDRIPERVEVNISLDSKVDYFIPLIWRGFKISPKVSFRIDDLSDLDLIFKKFSSNIRSTINRAKKKVEIVYKDDIGLLFQLLDKTFHKQNIENPWPKDIIAELYNKAKENNACKLVFALDAEGNVHSGNLFVYDEKVFYNFISGTDPEFKNSGAATLLLWEGIVNASEVSCAFDFEGSMIKGIHEFYRRFGAKQIVYYNLSRCKVSKGAELINS